MREYILEPAKQPHVALDLNKPVSSTTCLEFLLLRINSLFFLFVSVHVFLFYVIYLTYIKYYLLKMFHMYNFPLYTNSSFKKTLLGSRGDFTLSRRSSFAQRHSPTSKIHGSLSSSSLKQRRFSGTFCGLNSIEHIIYLCIKNEHAVRVAI